MILTRNISDRDQFTWRRKKRVENDHVRGRKSQAVNDPVKGLQKRRLSLLLVLVFSLLLAGCSGQNVLLAAFNPVVDAADSADREQVLTYLDLAVQDLAVIDVILADSDLDLLEQGTGSDEELTEAMIERYQSLLTGYRASLAEAKEAEIGRVVPDVEDLLLYRDAHNVLLDMTDDLLAEYEQILSYTAALMQMGTSLEALDTYDANDLQATYDTINAALLAAVEQLNNADVPTFLTYMNDNLIDALGEMDEAVLYMLQAASISDPLRINAASYRMDILMRRFDSIVANVDQDITDRQDKLIREVERIAETKDGLKTWATQNIDLLDQD